MNLDNLHLQRASHFDIIRVDAQLLQPSNNRFVVLVVFYIISVINYQLSFLKTRDSIVQALSELQVNVIFLTKDAEIN